MSPVTHSWAERAAIAERIRSNAALRIRHRLAILFFSLFAIEGFAWANVMAGTAVVRLAGAIRSALGPFGWFIDIDPGGHISVVDSISTEAVLLAVLFTALPLILVAQAIADGSQGERRALGYVGVFLWFGTGCWCIGLGV